MPKAPKMTLAPWRLLVFLSWGTLEGITLKGSHLVLMNSGPLCRRLQINYRELWAYVRKLEDNGYLEVVKKDRGSALVKLTCPPAFKEDR